ncbi:MAG: hypothetical protein DMG61_24060 [Acidobacteria bacterium]|nr:MAG: hypothetical protein DMG61_24060 [Acidobacteriota bacterium]PYY19658.1 MAG: hypothetical protein DMG60_03425 [Acidobacteriota bacterium]
MFSSDLRRSMATFVVLEFQLASFLANAHAQTFAAALLRRTAFVPKVEPWFISMAGEKNQVRCDCSWQDFRKGTAGRQ